MTTRIETTFKTLRREGRKALVGYLTVGDPDMRRSEQNIRLALKNGVDILELGIPFSDPTADGPAIQGAARRALAAGTTVEKAIGLVKRIRKDFEAPIILFGYANPFFRYGYKRLCNDAAKAGADGLLVVDMPFEESAELLEHMQPRRLAMIRLVAPTTEAGRARKILGNADGFVYYITVTGVTGTRSGVRSDIAGHIAMVRRCTKLPVVAGFGIGNGRQARAAARHADGVVVGSALVMAAHSGRLKALVGELRRALD